MNNIPLNGRIAIIDDKIEQALPLISVLAQKRHSYSYYSGDVKFLPKDGETTNDIRVLFLDINLIDDAVHDEKELKAKLVPVLSRIISKDNHPFVLVYWSRNEAEHSKLVNNIFEVDLKDRKPIAFVSQNKLAYFNLDGSQTEDFEINIKKLFGAIDDELSRHTAYNYLVGWENKVHNSADKTLQEIFNTPSHWSHNASYLIEKLGESFAGKNSYKNQPPQGKIKSAFQAFNNVFYDTLEYSINNSSLGDESILEYDNTLANRDSIYTINKKLLISDENSVMEYSGSVTEDSNEKTNKAFESLLNDAFKRSKVEAEIKHDFLDKNKTSQEIDKLVRDKCSKKRKEIRASWKKIYFVVTPLCDYVQSKAYNVRVIKGMLIKADLLSFIDEKSEAIFISPKFKYNNEKYAIVLHFRYFFTSSGGKGIKGLSTLFRVRQQMLSEIQSKLARHVNRQGMLFLEEYD